MLFEKHFELNVFKNTTFAQKLKHQQQNDNVYIEPKTNNVSKTTIPLARVKVNNNI